MGLSRIREHRIDQSEYSSLSKITFLNDDMQHKYVAYKLLRIIHTYFEGVCVFMPTTNTCVLSLMFTVRKPMNKSH